MISTSSLKRKTVFVVNIILAAIAVAMMAQSASAEIRTIAEARETLVVSDFVIDTVGLGRGEYKLRILSINDDGTFRGRYFREEKSGRSPNVGGIIRIETSGGLTTVKISFTVDAVSVQGIVSGGITFEGAMRLFPLDIKIKGRNFMAGTFTINSPSGFGFTGPFPFVATNTQVYR